MKKIFLPIGITVSLLFFSCDVMEQAADILIIEDGTEAEPALTNTDVIAGLKEALNIGIKNSVDLTSVADGFLGNSEIRLPFPEEAIKVKEKALDWGLDNQVDKFEETLNRAAETAAIEALPIFKDAILNMSISDGFAILNGGEGAATNFLKNGTSNALKIAFRPKVESAISEVKLTEYWDPIITKYNSAMTFTGGEKLNPDLAEYVTDKAIIGLFIMVAKEEDKIRLDPAAQVTALLQKVFGSIMN